MNTIRYQVFCTMQAAKLQVPQRWAVNCSWEHQMQTAGSPASRHHCHHNNSCEGLKLQLPTHEHQPVPQLLAGASAATCRTPPPQSTLTRQHKGSACSSCTAAVSAQAPATKHVQHQEPCRYTAYAAIPRHAMQSCTEGALAMQSALLL